MDAMHNKKTRINETNLYIKTKIIMKDFFIGLAIGVLGAYVAVKLTDEDSREKIKEVFDDGVSYGLELSEIAKQKATDIVDKLTHKTTDVIESIEKKA